MTSSPSTSAAPSPTSACSTRASGEMRVAKVPSTADPIEGVMAGVREAGVDLANTALFSHGTTVATNALITRRLPPAAMVTTEGFRDVIEIRRGNKEDLWDAYKDVAPPPISAPRPLEVPSGSTTPGNVLEPLDEDGARQVAGAAAPARGRDRRRLLHQLLRQPGQRAAHARDPGGGAAGRRRLHLVRGAAGDLRARALLDHGRQRRAAPARRPLRAASSRPSSPTAATTATCCCCTPAAA